MTTVDDLPPCEKDEQKEFISPNKEWDLCVQKGTLTVGAGMAAGMFLGTLMGMGVPLVWGTGAGILWSVKRCRALMRDGIMTPEKLREVKEEKAKARLEKRRALEEEKKRKKMALAAVKPKPKKAARSLDVPKGEHECCKQLKELLEQQKKKECELLKKVEKELSKCGTVDKSLIDQLKECPLDEDKEKTETPKGDSAVSVSKLNFKATTTVKLFVPQSPAFRTRITANGTDVCMCRVDKDGKMETCSGCASLLSSSKELNEPIKLTLLNDNVKQDVDDDGGMLEAPKGTEDKNYEEEKNYTVVQPEEEETKKNPSDLLVLQEVSSFNDGQNEDEDYEDAINSELFVDEQQSAMEDDMEEGVIEINGNRIEVIIQEVDDDLEDDDDASTEPEVTFPEFEGDFPQKLSSQDEESTIEDLEKEEVIFVETYKSESWPFSFSLPSLDKFHKQSKDSSFKWPPLPSSIIVKPRKDQPCTCAGGSAQGDQVKEGHGNLQAEPLNFEPCTCGHPEDECKCKAQGHT